MPSATTDSDILEDASCATACDPVQALPRVLPTPRRGQSLRFASLHSLGLLLRKLYPHREQAHVLQGSQEPVMAMNVLARRYPDIYLRATSWSI
jgi:hypothetical protein